MRVAIIGAGISGLAAARKLHQSGHSVVVYEKSKSVAGRCSTRRVEGFTFDTGATSVAPRRRSLESVMLQELDTTDLIKIEKPIWAMNHGRIAPGDAAKMAIDRFCYRSGINQLAKLLAAGLEIKFDAPIEALAKSGDRWMIEGEEFDGVILAIPVPQCAPLLQSIGEGWRLGNVRYRSCISVLLGYDKPFDAPYHAAIDPEQRNPIIWVSAESVKCPGRAPEGHSAFVAQMGARFSQDHFEDSDFELLREAKVMMERLFGKDFAVPVVAQVKRWKYSQPESAGSFENANRSVSTLVLAGDGLAGPRVELAFESGVQAANFLLETRQS